MLWSHLRLWHCQITSVTLMSGRQNASRKGLSLCRAVEALYCTIRLSYSFSNPHLVSSTSSQMQLSRPAGSARLLLSKTPLVSVSHQPMIYNHFRQLAVCEVHQRKMNRQLCDCNRGQGLFWWVFELWEDNIFPIHVSKAPFTSRLFSNAMNFMHCRSTVVMQSLKFNLRISTLFALTFPQTTFGVILARFACGLF